jgi:glutamyl-tRNA synthetase
LSVPERSVTVRDELLGERSFDVQAEVGDFLIAKRDRAPAYQLAGVVDDARQGVTEVVRGEDLFASAARQKLLQQALGLPEVRYVHVPLVLDETGRRLAKREDDLSLQALREGGTDPRAVVAWAAKSCGIASAERITARVALIDFALAKIPREPLILDAATLANLREAY